MLLASDLIDAFHTEHAGDFANISQNRLQLPAIGDFQAGINTRIRTIGSAFQTVNVGAGAADHSSDIRQQSGTVARPNRELHLKGCRSFTAPFNGYAPFRLIHQILHVRTSASMNRDSPPARDIAHDVVPGHGIAALGAIHKKVVIAFDDQGSLAKAEHALDSFNQGRFGVFDWRFGAFYGIAENASKHLARGILAKPHGSIEVFNLGKPGIGCHPQHFFFWNLLEAAPEMARFLFQQALSHLHGFFALLQIDPVADFAARVRRLNKAQPIAARPVPLLRENLDHIAAHDFVAQGHHLPVNLGAHALMAYFRMHQISEVDRSGATRKLQHASLGSESINLHGSKIDLQCRQKFARLFQFLRPLDQLPHPGDSLVVFLLRLTIFVFPVRGHTFFRDAMHFLGTNLHFKWLAPVQHGRVQGLIKIWPRHGDVVLEAAGHRAPDVVHDAQRRVTVALAIADDADRKKIVNLLEAALLAHNLAVQGIQPLYPSFQLRGNAIRSEEHT